MSSILTHIAITDGKIKQASLEVVSRARELAEANGLENHAVITDPDPNTHVEVLKSYGIDKIFTVANPIFKNHLNAPVIEALAKVISDSSPQVVAFPSTEATKDIMGALATKTGGGAIPEASSFELNSGKVEALRPVMASKVMAKTVSDSQPVLVSVSPGAYDVSEKNSDPEVVSVDFEFDESSLKQTLREVIKSTGDGQIDLSEARVIVAAGRGVKDEEGKKLIEELAEATGAAIGASRAVTESGLFPATLQIGQTGKDVSPELYFAIGISGAIQHVAGMSNSKVIVAINKDPDATIFDYATYGLVGDLFKILPALTEEIKKIKNS